MLQGAPAFIELRHAIGQVLQAGLRLGLRVLRAGQLRAQTSKPRFIGHIQRLLVSRQALMAHAQRAQLLFNMALLCGQHLQLLLHLRHAGTLRVGFGLGLAQRFFERRQLVLLLLKLSGQQLGFFFGIKTLTGQRFGLYRGVFAARGPLGGLLFQLDQSLLYAQPTLDDKADFCFQPTHFGAGFIEFALRLVDMVARRVMCLADSFQIGFDMAQIGNAAFQVVD